MKSFVIGASLVAVGMWYIHHAVNYSRAPEPDEKNLGEIVIAKAPDGSLQGRWPGQAPTPTATRSK